MSGSGDVPFGHVETQRRLSRSVGFRCPAVASVHLGESKPHAGSEVQAVAALGKLDPEEREPYRFRMIAAVAQQARLRGEAQDDGRAKARRLRKLRAIRQAFRRLLPSLLVAVEESQQGRSSHCARLWRPSPGVTEELPQGYELLL